MIRSLYFLPGKPIQTNIPPKEFPALMRNKRGLLWVDFIGEPQKR